MDVSTIQLFQKPKLPPIQSSSSAIKFNLEDSTLGYFSKLCKIFVFCGIKTFSSFLNSLCQNLGPLNWLAEPELHKTLRRLKIRGMLDEDQWCELFPLDKTKLDFPPTDLTLQLILVKYSGMISEPQPNGWIGPAHPDDYGSGAWILRLEQCRKNLSKLTQFSSSQTESYQYFLSIIRSALVHFYGDSIKNDIKYIHNEKMTEEEQLFYVNEFEKLSRRHDYIAKIEERIKLVKSKRPHDIPMLQKHIKAKENSILKLKNLDRTNTARGLGNSNQADDDENNLSTIRSRWFDIRSGMIKEEKQLLEKFYTRLTTEVKPDAMIDHLLNKHVLNIEESGEIFSCLNSSDQMKILLDILVMKTGSAFVEFMNAMKPRSVQLYNDLYEEYMSTMEQLMANKPDAVPYCNELLADWYVRRFAEWKPISWYPDASVNLNDFYCNQNLIDNKGLKLHADRILHGKISKMARLTIIEGHPGTGKTTLAQYLAQKWALRDPKFHSLLQFKLVFLVDLRIATTNFKSMIFEQLFSADFKLTERELWNVVEENQQDCLFLVDGYHGFASEEIYKVLIGKFLPDVKIILFSDPEFLGSLKKHSQYKITLTGFHSMSDSIDFIKKYIRLAEKPVRSFSNFIRKLWGNEDSSSAEEYEKWEEQIELEKANEEKNGDQNKKAGANSSLSPGLGAARTTEIEFADRDPGFMIRQRAGSIVSGSVMGFTRRNSQLLRSASLNFNKTNEAGGENASGGGAPAREATELSVEAMKQFQANREKQLKWAALRYYCQFPLYCSFFCAMTDMRLSIDITSWTAMFDQFITAIKLRLIEVHRDMSNRFIVNKWFGRLTELAMDSVRQKSLIISSYQSKEELDFILKFGLVQRLPKNLSEDFKESLNAGSAALSHLENEFTSNQLENRFAEMTSSNKTQYFFRNRLMQMYLSAKCLETSGSEEAARYFQNTVLTRQNQEVALFYCSIKKNESESIAIRTLFSKIIDAVSPDSIQNKLQQWSTSSFESLPGGGNDIADRSPIGSSGGGGNAALLKSNSPSNRSSGLSGKIMDFDLCLKTLAVIEGRSDLAKMINRVLPEHLIIDHSGLISVLTLQGLSYLLLQQPIIPQQPSAFSQQQHNANRLKQLDLRLGYLQSATPSEAIAKLAKSIQKNTRITKLRIFWSQLGLMTTVFSSIFLKNTAIETLELIDESHLNASSQTRQQETGNEARGGGGGGRNHPDSSSSTLTNTNNQHRSTERLTAKISNNMRMGCRHMTHVSNFAFKNCSQLSLTNSVLRNLPADLQCLDLSGCTLTIIACQDLSEKISQCTELRKLIMCQVKLESMAFNNFIRSLAVNRSILELNLSNVKMDNVCFFTLAESLKLNNKLERLLLYNVTVNNRSCEELVQVMKINGSLRELHLTQERVSSEGRLHLIRNCRHVKIVGIKLPAKKLPLAEESITDVSKYAI